ncbi:AMP-binding protein [Micromonospora sp. NPDC048843]|uniref:class I adenylate-forming enzyme family protein n=1 Tax=Micromonospora sp. NPDC048843 TaxID=3155389 RepID=UPI0033CD9442
MDEPVAHPTVAPCSVAGLLDRAAQRWPQAVAVTDTAGSWTYAELRSRARAFSAWLLAQSVTEGGRVILRMDNRRAVVPAIFGTLLAGAVGVPVNPHMRPFQLNAVLRECAPATVVAVDAEALAATELPPGVRVYHSDAVSSWCERWIDERGADAGVAWRAAGVADDPERLGLMIYTSGSTSMPKAVMSPHRAIDFVTGAIAARLGYRCDDVVLCALPVSFDYGLYQIFLAALAGAELVLMESDSQLRLLHTMSSRRVTVVPVVPSLAQLLVRLARRPTAPRPQVRLFTNTGAALPGPLITQLRDTFPEAAVVLMYGTTECKRITIADPDVDRVRPGSVGTPLPGTTVTVLDAVGAAVQAGTVGEIVVHGPHVMSGYYNAPALTERRFRRDRLGRSSALYTGDFGWLDRDGHLYFAGRRDDLFKRRGVRASLAEIEAAALDVRGVTAAAALPPDENRDLTLAVVSEVPPSDVLRGIALRLEAAKVPAACVRLPELPLTTNGKTDRAALVAMLFE